ncbi:MAG: efflux RND transporter permease subunit [candidate division WOR-3 bacterium]|nr:efflux RND transporter permease subunit [candidate division WOR-3 bacterium]
MKITEIAIRRPILTFMVALAFILFGIIGVLKMPIDLFPKVELPVAVIATLYPGAGPEEVEQEVTKELEKQISTVSGVKEITSRSMENFSIIIVTFDWGIDLDAATNDIRDKLDLILAELPKEVNRPYILKFDPSMIPVMNLALIGDVDEATLSEIGKDLEMRLQRVFGVGAVIRVGGAEEQVKILINLKDLYQAGITLDNILMALKAQNLNFPVGYLNYQNEKYLLRVVGRFSDLKDIENLIIGYKNNQPIFLKDIGEIKWEKEEKENFVRFKGKDCIFFAIQKKPQANTVVVANNLRKEVEKIQKELPENINFLIVFDTSELIKRSINNLINNLLLGAILAVAILFVFLRRFQATIYVAFAIPLSLFFSLFFMYLFGFSINILSISGLAIAVGMLVDCSIVVFESIYRHHELGYEPIIASQKGTEVVGTAVTASTLTTIGVFLPLLFITGILSVFFKELSLTVTFALISSLFVALTLIPLLTSKFFKWEEKEERGLKKFFKDTYEKLENFYMKVINYALRHRKLVILSILGLFLLSLSLLAIIGFEFFPEQQIRRIEVIAEMPIGTNLYTTDKAIKELERYIMERYEKDIDAIVSQVGGAASIYQTVFREIKTSNAEITLVLKREKKGKLKEIEEEIRKKAKEIPGLKVRVTSTRGYVQFGGIGGSNLNIEIYGDDLEKARELTKKIINAIETIPYLVDIKGSLEEAEPEIQFLVDRNKAILYGLTPYQIGYALRTKFVGEVATKYRTGGKEYEIILKLKREDIDDIKNVENIFINSPFGQVLLKDIAEIRLAKAPTVIEHKNTQRVATITGNVVGQSLGRVAMKVKGIIDKMEKPIGFSIKITGAYEEMVKSYRDLAFAILIAIILVYMIMAAQFESFLYPFVIMFTVPLAIIGVIFMLLITNTTFSLISGIGILVLVGIVVNNGIVYVDYVNQLIRKEGMPLKEAVIKGCQIRMRPILMTALTTIFGLLPLALKLGEGSELWSPLGISVIGGLLFSTVLTLIFIPVLYYIFSKKENRL